MARKRNDIFRLSERVMQMDDEVWARHANPLSVYSWFSVLPLATVAIWSRVWLSWWALVPIALVVLWTWWNPRAFGKPASTNCWASQVTFGERLFLDRKANPIPQHHARWGLGLIWLSVLGLPFWAYGLWRFDPGLTLFGLALLMLGKTWFADRMVWLYRDMTV